MKAEKLIKDYTRHCSNELCAVEDKYGKKVISYRDWLTPEQALSAVKIARDEVIEKACQFIETYPHLFMGVLRSEVIEDFKKYMEWKEI